MKVLIVISVLLALAFGEPPVYRQQNQQQRRYYFARQEVETTTPFATTEAPTPAEAPYPASGWKPDGPAFDLPQRQVGNSYVPARSFGSRTPTLKQQYGAPDSQAAEVQPQENQQQQQQQRFGNTEFQPRQQQQQQQFSTSQNQFQQQHYLAAVFQPQINQYGVPEPQEQFQPPRPDQEYGVPLTTTEEPATTTEIEDSTTTSTPQTDSEVEPVNSVNELDEEGDLDEQQAQQQQRQQGEYYIALPDGRLQRVRYVSHQDVEAMKYFARIRAENVEPLRGPIYSYSPLQEVQFAPASLRLAPNSADSSSASTAASSSSAKLELQEEAAPSPPLAAVVRYPYDTPSPVIPLGGASSYSANYRVPASTERRYFISF